MKLLIVSATEAEIAPTLQISKKNVDFLVTGPGMVSTTYYLTKKLSEKKFDLVINAGIAGSFNRDLIPGDTVTIFKDCFYDLGAEDGEVLIPFYELSISGTDALINNKFIENDFSIASETFRKLKRVTGITVNTVHGNEKNIEKAIASCNPDIETMETAAVFYTCLKEKQNVIAIRSISNYVERRDKNKWQIEKSIISLNVVLEKLIVEINR